MKKLLFIIGVITALSFQSNAQTKKLLGATFQVNKEPNSIFDAPLGEIDNNIFYLSDEGRNTALVKYCNGKQLKSLELPNKSSKFQRKGSIATDEFYFTDNHIFEVVKNKKLGVFYYFIIKYDQNLKASEPKLLLTSDSKTKSSIQFVEGKDDLIVLQRYGYTETSFNLKISKINNDLNLQIIEKIKIDAESEHIYKLKDLQITNNQLAFIGEKIENGIKVIHFEFFKIDLNTAKKTRFDIDFKDIYQNIHDYHINQTFSDYHFNIDGDKLFIKGFLTEDPRTRFLGGIFSCIYNLKDGSLTSHHSLDFDKEFIFQNYDSETIKEFTERYEKVNNRYLMKPLRILEDKMMEDGSSIILGEYHRVFYSTDDGSTYYHRDFLFFKIGPNGKILWIKKIKRHTYSSHHEIGEVFTHFKGDQLFLIYENQFQINATKIDVSTGENETIVVFLRKEIKNYHTDFRHSTKIKKDNFTLRLFRGIKDDWALEIYFED